MISDTLCETLDEIERYQRDMPQCYDDIRDRIEAVKAEMRGLQMYLDAPPDMVRPPETRSWAPEVIDGWCLADAAKGARSPQNAVAALALALLRSAACSGMSVEGYQQGVTLLIGHYNGCEDLICQQVVERVAAVLEVLTPRQTLTRA